MKKREGNRGFTLIEVLVYMSAVAVLFTIVSISMQNQKIKQDFAVEKRNISMFVRKIQQYAQQNRKEYILDFQISKKTVFFMEEVNGKKDIIDKMTISGNISYMKNNTDRNADFIRRTTKEGNFERGFSIYLLNKKGDKIYYRISTNTINAAKYPIISIYRAKNPINIKDDYTKSQLWEEEL